MFFSIIIPALNEEDYIGLLLDSIVKQDFPDYEVIVVNGLSQDNTSKIVSDFTGVKLLSSIKNNISHQRNLGGNIAKGKYLLFFDSDIVLPPGFLTSLYKQLVNHQNIDIYNSYLVPLSDKKIDHFLYFLLYLIIKASLLVKPGFPGSFIGIKREIFDKIKGFDEKIIFGEDQEFTERAVKNRARPYLFYKPSLFVSVRRFNLQGRKTIIKIFLRYLINIFTKNYFTQPVFDYPFGAYTKKDAAQSRVSTKK